MTTTTTTTNPAMAALLARAQEIAAKNPTPKRTAAPRECACGCGGMTRGGTWLPGHDAKALSWMLAEIRSGSAPAAAPKRKRTPKPTQTAPESQAA